MSGQTTHLPDAHRPPGDEVRPPMPDVCVALVPVATLLVTGALTAYGLRFLRD
ncbi:hypothetical protein ITJ44_04825 [Clavibacter sp. VKM Ac-2873]|uniref:hypothetical protein n=1 Tax=Clavibacter sp. VKM Ac-2873 TaxID=2783813 RepID=UPI001889E78A|nr:hypothetical protein [Clavibacter sp. VKM Ac-2873]MBF4617396.1 hypothetical protein [Clavibacter sp. VKM Ac-2873]